MCRLKERRRRGACFTHGLRSWGPKCRNILWFYSPLLLNTVEEEKEEQRTVFDAVIHRGQQW